MSSDLDFKAGTGTQNTCDRAIRGTSVLERGKVDNHSQVVVLCLLKFGNVECANSSRQALLWLVFAAMLQMLPEKC